MTGEAYENGKATNECPPVAGTTEGASIAWTANAPAEYNATGAAGKGKFALPEKSAGRPDSRSAIPPRLRGTYVAFRASDGRIWAYDRKKGRVLHMLATQCQGVTQWDCLPWHTRLGASIHIMRRAGLQIETVREGDCHHARYFLRTPGTLLPKGSAQ